MIRLNARWAAPLVGLLIFILLTVSCSLNSSLTNPTPAPSDSALSLNLRRGRTMQALYQIEALAAQSGWTPDLQRQAGDLWRDAGDLSAAVAYWQAAFQTQPDHAELARRLAQVYVDLGRWTQAAGVLARLVELDPLDTWAHYQFGLIQAPFDPQTAITHLQMVAGDPIYGAQSLAVLNVLLDNPTDPLISMRVGIAMVEQELWPYAEVAFRQAAFMGQPYPEALAYAGLARDQQGKDGGPWFQRALILAPQNPQALYLNGLHLRYLKQYQQSLDSLIQAASLDPQNPAILSELGTAYRLLDDLPNAEYWLKAAVTFSGDDSRFCNLLALFYAEESYNLTGGGIAALQQAAALQPDDPEVLAAYGWALYTIGDTPGALAQLDAALNVAPDNPRALYYKAQIWLESGNAEGARPLFQQVANTDSEFAAEARRVLDGLGN